MFLDDALSELKAMTDADNHIDADDLLVNVILFCGGAMKEDYPVLWTDKLIEIVAAYKAVPKRYE